MATGTGVVASWGNNGNGQLGNNSTVNSGVPVAVTATGALSGKTVIQVSGGQSHACALTSEGRVYCWGYNGYGQLGDGTTTQRNVPVAIDASGALAGKSVVQISSQYSSTCALTSEGKIYCWGMNSGGQLGNNTTTSSSTPVAVYTGGLLSGKTVVRIGSGAGTGCAVTSDGGVYCWGNNANSEMGIGSAGGFYTVPTAVVTSGALAGKTVIEISGGANHTCALTSSGSAYCWGYNSSGQLGDNSATQKSVPVAVDTSGALNGKSVAHIVAGYTHTCAVTSDGGAYCWGSNSYGELGGGWTGSVSRVPSAVDVSGVLAGKALVQVAAGYNYSCGLTSDGAAYCWGRGLYGQLGYNSSADSNVPVAVVASGVLASEFVAAISGSEGGNFNTVAAPSCGPGASIATGSGALWTRVALPCNNYTLASPTVSAVFGSDSGGRTGFANATYGVENKAGLTGWAVYRYDPASAMYVMLSLSDTLVRGTGYWIKSYETPYIGKMFVDGYDPAATPITAPVTQAQGCASANGCFAISVTAVAGQSRYNLLGNPFPWAVDWSQARVRVDGSASTYTPSQAAAANVLAATFWTWNGTSYDVYSDTAPNIGNLPYFGSFWVQALAGGAGHTVELLVPKLATTRP